MEGSNGPVIVYGSNAVTGLAVIATAIIVAFIVRLILRRLFDRFPWGPRVGRLITSTIFHGILIFGVLTGLGTMGINMGPVIAGLGLGGFALGFAFRDALSNLLAGMLIIIYRPFIEGETISVMGCQGKVTEINLRYTVLAGETERFMIPNSLIFTKPLKIVLSKENESQ